MENFTKQVIEMMEETNMTYGEAADRIIEYFKSDFLNERSDLEDDLFEDYNFTYCELLENNLI